MKIQEDLTDKRAVSEKFRRILFFTVIASFFLFNEYSSAQYFTRITSWSTYAMVGEIVNDGGTSAGASWGDYDNDGFLDLFVANWGGGDNFLYRNNGDGSFSKIRNGSIVNDGGWSSGPCWGDYDNDGDLDLFVANQSYESNFLYRNDGDGRFAKITEGDIVNDYGNNHTCSWGDLNNDGYLDMFVANDAGKNFLYQNNGDGTFTKITEGDLVNEDYSTNSGSWADFDNDGDLDLFVANKGGKNNVLFVNNGEGGFTGVSEGAIVNDGGQSNGGSWGDYDNDGDLDLFVANGPFFFAGENNFLYKNNGDGSFTKITDTPVTSDSAKSMSGSWADFDNDGDLDLHVTSYVHDDLYYVNNGDGTFARNRNGMFVNFAGYSTGNPAADYDNDGDLDIFLANWENQNNVLYRNESRGNNWIIVKCKGIGSNSFGVGTKVRIQTDISEKPVNQLREITTQYGYRSQGAMHAHFGLGNAGTVNRIEVEWLSGKTDVINNVSANQVVTVTEGEGITETVPPPSPPKQSIVRLLFGIYRNEGIEEVLNRYQELLADEPDKYDFSETSLVNLGNYILLYMNNSDDSFRIILKNIESYPESGRNYIILGDIGRRKGEFEAAREHYLKARDLISKNSELEPAEKKYFLNEIGYHLKNLK